MTKVVKTFELASSSKLELVEVDLDKFEIHLNGKIQATEFDYDRACETFDNLVQYYS